MARIAIYIGRHLATAPRPVKEADALAAAGHDVTVSGLWFDAGLVARDHTLLAGRPWRFLPYADCQPGNAARRWRWWHIRFRHRLAKEWFRLSGRVTAEAFGYATSRMLAHARAHPADLHIFHSEGGLWVGRQLHRAGQLVGVDFEDWFSRDLPPEKHTARPVAALRELEHAALRFGPYALTTSRSLAAALAAAYSAPPPTAVYNTFPAQAAPVSPSLAHATKEGPVALHWFSLVLGPDRGLEPLFAALPRLTFAWNLTVRAEDPDGYAARLLSALPDPLRAQVRFVPTVPNDELPAYIAEHDVGLALDLSTIPSRNLTVTNKLFQYLQAGLAIVASDTAGHREVLEQSPGAGEIFTAGEPSSLAGALNRLCCDRAQLQRARRAARAAGATVFDHARQEPVYAELVRLALDPA